MDTDGDPTELSLQEAESSNVSHISADGPESFGDLSCITTDENNKDINENQHEIESDQDVSMSEDVTYDPTALLEVSDVLGLVGKKWLMFRVSPLWNLNFSTNYLEQLSKQLNNFLVKHITTNLKNHNNFQISVKFEAKESQHECIALKIEVINHYETETNLYTGLLLKSLNYTEKYSKNNLSDMPVLMIQGNKMFITAVNNWFTNHFDCVIRRYEFAQYQFLWLIAISMGDAGQLYDESVVYNYIYNYEFSKGKMDVKCSIESEFLRSTLAKISLNRSEVSFNYLDLIKVQSEIDDFFKITSGINTSKLKLNSFEAPKVASINVSGKIQVWSSSLMDLMLKYLMEVENN